MLSTAEFERAWWDFYVSTEPILEQERRFPLINLVSSNRDLTLEAIIWFLERFGWTEPNVEAIKQDMSSLERGVFR